MEVIKATKDLTPEQIYYLTMSQNTQKMIEHDGEIVEFEAYALFKDFNSEGEEKEVLTLVTEEGEVFGTISETFKRDFFKMVEFFESQNMTVKAIKIFTGESKNKRTFVSCMYQKV